MMPLRSFLERDFWMAAFQRSIGNFVDRCEAANRAVLSARMAVA